MSGIHETFTKTSCWYLKMVQTNKQTNKKPTNIQAKQFWDWQYLSNIKSSLHQIFRDTLCGYPKTIQINIKTNKEKESFLNWQYLSQIKS